MNRLYRLCWNKALNIFSLCLLACGILQAQTWSYVGNQNFSDGTATFSSIATNGTTPYVAYVDGSNGDKVTVKKLNGSNWVTVGTTSISSSSASYTSLAFYGSSPYVAYADGSKNGRVTVKKFDGSNWVTVGTEGFAESNVTVGTAYVSLAFDGATPYVAYQDLISGGGAGNRFCTVMKFNGSEWVVVGTPRFSSNAAYYITMTILNGMPHVNYQDFSSARQAVTMAFNGSNWVNVATSTERTQYNSAVVSGGKLYTAFTNLSNTRRKTTAYQYDGSSWSVIGYPSFTAGQGDYVSIGASDAGVIYVAYADFLQNKKASVMQYDASKSSNWTVVGTEGFTPDQADHVHLVVGSSGIYVLFSDASNGGKASVMKYTVCTPATSISTISAVDTYTWNSQIYTSSGTYTKTFSGVTGSGCDSTATLNLTIIPSNKWTGVVNSDWSNYANWSLGKTPIASDLVVVQNAGTPPVLNGTATIQSLTVQTGASLTLGNTASLQIQGSITNNGNLSAESGTIALMGASIQNISSSMFTGNKVNNLVIGNSAGVNILSKLDVAGNLTINSGASLNITDTLSLAGSITNSGVVTANNATLVLNGTNAPQKLIANVFSNNTLKDLVVNNPQGITVESTLTISRQLVLNSGIVTMVNNNSLVLTNTSSVANASATSYVDGAVTKTGDKAFTFPLGNNGTFAPISISAPSSASDQFTASYVRANPLVAMPGTTLDTSLTSISTKEFWNVKQTTGSSAVTLTAKIDATTGSSFAAQWAALDQLTNWVKWYSKGKTSASSNNGALVVTSPLITQPSGSFSGGAKLSSNARLATFATDGLNDVFPAFNPDSLNYVINLPSFSLKLIQFVVTPQDSAASLTLNGNGDSLKSGVRAVRNFYNDGTLDYTITVTAADKVTSKQYKFHLNVLPYSTATLNSLSVSTGTLSPAFNTDIYTYTVLVPATVSSISIASKPTDYGSSLKLQGVSVNAQVFSSPIGLTFGKNNLSLVVRSNDGAVEKNYSIMVNRVLSSDATLKVLGLAGGLSLTPIFQSATTSYTANVPSTLNASALIVWPTDSNATVFVNGTKMAYNSRVPVSFQFGSNTISIKIIAQDGVTEKTYTLVATKAITACSYTEPVDTIQFIDAGIANYTVPCDVSSIKVNAWGAGAGGGYSIFKNGGGGGAFASASLNVVTSQHYNLYIGSGGMEELNGESSFFQDPTADIDEKLVEAAGGSASGSGGNIGSSTGTVVYTGGDAASSTYSAFFSPPSSQVFSFKGGYGGGAAYRNAAADRRLGFANGGNGASYDSTYEYNASTKKSTIYLQKVAATNGQFPGGGGGQGYVDVKMHGGSGGDGKIEIIQCRGTAYLVTPPSATSAVLGHTATFTAVASNNLGVRYEWYRNGFLLAKTTGATLVINNISLADSGSYRCVLFNACDKRLDSSDYVPLTILKSVKVNLSVTACGSYVFNGQTYTSKGDYTWNTVTAAGADSTVALSLTIKNPSYSTRNVKACGSYLWKGVTYTVSTQLYDTLMNASGCDSVVTVQLTINNPTSSTTTATICLGNNYSFNGNNYGASGTYQVTLTNAAGCDSIATLLLTANRCVNTWTGTIDNNWNNPANWSNGAVPNSNMDVVIGVSSKRPLIAGVVIAVDFTIMPGASVNVVGTLQVSGNWMNNGNPDIGKGTVVLQGNGHTIQGSTLFGNLSIAGNYVVGNGTADKIDVTGILNKLSGTLNTNNKLTLKSTATATGLIQESGGNLTGKITMERYVSGSAGFHHLSSPVTNTNVGTWGKYFAISGKDGVRSYTPGQVGTLQEYREAANTKSVLDSGFYNYTNGDAAITSGKGYTAWLIKTPTAFASVGTPANGTINYNVTYKGSNATTRGWNFIGNPYPSPISWSALRSLNLGVWGDQACYIWKATGGTNGNWQTYDGTVGTNGVGNVIASSQGFFVLVNKNASLLFDNSIRTTDLSPTFFGTTRLHQLRLQLVNPNNEAESDEVVAYTKAGITQPVVSVKPPMPIETTNASLSFLHEGKQAGIEALANIKSGDELALNISTPVAGIYLLKVGDYKLTMSAYLKDAQTGHYTELKEGVEIAIATEATISNTRYSVVFGRPAAAVVATNSAYKVFAVAKAIEVTNAVAVHNAKVVVYNTLGQQIATATMNGTRLTIPVSAQTNATYLVRIVGENVVKVIVP